MWFEQTYQKGDILMEEGHFPQFRNIYIIREGEVSAFKNISDLFEQKQEILKVLTLGSGDIICEDFVYIDSILDSSIEITYKKPID